MGEIYRNDSLLSNFPPCLRENILELCLNSQTGLSSISFTDITPLSPKRNTTKDSLSYDYHFALKIPYAGKFLKWELIFNPEDYTFAPDFDFNDDYFLARPDVDTVIEKVPSLLTWNIKNSKSLASVLKELLIYYKETQVQRLETENMFSHIFNEYSSLVCDEVLPTNVEVMIENSTVHFLIKFKVDYSKLPEYLQPPETEETGLQLNPGEDYVNLRVSFNKPDGSRVTPSLQLSPRLEQVLGGSKQLHVPPYMRDITLTEYRARICRLLKQRIDTIATRYQFRKEFITCLTTVRRHSVVEYDAETYSKAAFICEVDDYFCLVQVELDQDFPNKRPTVNLCSLYCMDSNSPCSIDVDDFPYSPRWASNEMVQKLLAHLANAVPTFKLHKH